MFHSPKGIKRGSCKFRESIDSFDIVKSRVVLVVVQQNVQVGFARRLPLCFVRKNPEIGQKSMGTFFFFAQQSQIVAQNAN